MPGVHADLGQPGGGRRHSAQRRLARPRPGSRPPSRRRRRWSTPLRRGRCRGRLQRDPPREQLRLEQSRRTRSPVRCRGHAKNASATASSPASAPVCDTASRAPASERPSLYATTGLPSLGRGAREGRPGRPRWTGSRGTARSSRPPGRRRRQGRSRRVRGRARCPPRPCRRSRGPSRHRARAALRGRCRTARRRRRHRPGAGARRKPRCRSAPARRQRRRRRGCSGRAAAAPTRRGSRAAAARRRSPSGVPARKPSATTVATVTPSSAHSRTASTAASAGVRIERVLGHRRQLAQRRPGPLAEHGLARRVDRIDLTVPAVPAQELQRPRRSPCRGRPMHRRARPTAARTAPSRAADPPQRARDGEPAAEHVLGDPVLQDLDRPAGDHPAAGAAEAVLDEAVVAEAGGAHRLHRDVGGEEAGLVRRELGHRGLGRGGQPVAVAVARRRVRAAAAPTRASPRRRRTSTADPGTRPADVRTARGSGRSSLATSKA